MATATAEITIDSPVIEVVARLNELEYISTGEPQTFAGDGGPAWYMTSACGGRMTVAEDLKLTEDGSETWIEVFEQSDKGLSERIFQFLINAFGGRASIFPEGKEAAL